MVVLCVVPTRAERRLTFAFFLLSGLDAFLDGTRGLAAVVAGLSAALGVGGERGSEEGEGEESAVDGHDLGEAEIRFKVTTDNSNQIPRSFISNCWTKGNDKNAHFITQKSCLLNMIWTVRCSSRFLESSDASIHLNGHRI